MLGGVVIALLVSALWMSAQVIAMQIRPAAHRFRSMLLGYLVSLPFVYLCYRALPVALPQTWQWLVGSEHALSILIHAYLGHLLLFFFYVECFYHVERAVTLRLLIEIMQQPSREASLRQIEADYNIDEMIVRRLEVLELNGFVEQQGDRWRLLEKGRRLARVMRLSCWIFQSKTQDERL